MPTIKVYTILIILFHWIVLPKPSLAQCNIEASVCQSGVSDPFNFIPTSGAYGGGSFADAGCATGIGGNHDYGFITLNITTSGPLNLLINGNSNGGFVDVAVFNIPNGIAPCDAIQNPNNAIGCNFASSASGCVQFGNAFSCPSDVPAPQVTAGQEIMIIAQDWSNQSSTFTLELGPAPGAQSGNPDATIEPAGPFCLGDNPFQLIANNLGGDWSGSGVDASGVFDPNIAGIGTHTINYTVGAGNCQSSDQIDITVNPGSPVFAEIVGLGQTTTICAGQEVNLSASGVESYNWNNGLGSGATHTVNPTSTTDYIVTGTDIDGCSNTDTVTVNVSVQPTATMSNNQIICPGDSAQISVTPGGGTAFTFNWGHTNTNSDSLLVIPSESSTYYVIIENEFGCTSDTGFVQVDLFPLPIIDFITDEPIQCNPALFEVTNASPGDSLGTFDYFWEVSTGESFENVETIELEILEPNDYDVTLIVTSSDGCTDTLTKNNFLTVLDSPIADFNYTPNPLTILNTEALFQNASQGAVDFEWSFESGLPSFSTNFSPTSRFPTGNVGEYEVILIATSDFGCKDTIIKDVSVVPEVTLFIPNTFTPDDDIFNETWRPYIDGIDIQNFELLIFNRYGEIVWESKDPSAAWDGTYGGRKVKEGTYIWKIRAADMITDKKYEWQGHVTVLY